MTTTDATWDGTVVEECITPGPTQRWQGSTRGQRSYSTVDLQRAAFLRKCRMRVKRSDAGLPSSRNARTTGLRREDVAVLSGVSVSWYAWLEQGRHISVSEKFLDRLCQALQLDEDERIYLYYLMLRHPPPMSSETQQEVPTDVLHMINSLNAPAILLNSCWDVLAWNAQQALIYRDYGEIPIEERNLVEIQFTRPVKHMTEEQFERASSRVMARFRFDYSCSTEKTRFDALIYRLNALSPTFRRLWRGTDFTLRSHGVQRFTHLRYGPLSLEHTSFMPDGHAHLRVIICTGEDVATRATLEQVNTEVASAKATPRSMLASRLVSRR